ncbi:MAG: hypothetical protein H0T89_25800 [Deltaproteobacteria bacterium]|nr:hypothetical protein [Deltaproteobacteria bacterium]MDQ3299775.1 hypothetical protein [Myxococcota bacterium]
MKRLVRFRSLFVAAALLVVPAACKDNAAGRAEKAAERVQDKAEDLREEESELAKEVREQREDAARDQDRADRLTREDGVEGLPDRVGDRLATGDVDDDIEDVADEARDVTDKAVDLAKAEDQFAMEKQTRISELRALHQVIASQPMLINALSGAAPLTDRARADVSEKMQIFQMRLDEAGNVIESLTTATAEDWEIREDTASDATDKLENARADAWEALHDGDRIGSS